jgi:hypothetical protein
MQKNSITDKMVSGFTKNNIIYSNDNGKARIGTQAGIVYSK